MGRILFHADVAARRKSALESAAEVTTSKADERSGVFRDDPAKEMARTHFRRLPNQFTISFALVERGSLRPTFVPIDEPHVVEPQQPEKRGVQIVDLQAVFRGE